jgi:predicted ATPase/DNA-binding CsgD family transcriptional regulator
MARATPRIRDGTLVAYDGGVSNTIRVGEVDWWRWLDAPGSTHFRFEQGADAFTARRERREGGWYWYAYRKRNGRLRKAYLGRTADLTADHLSAVAATLAHTGKTTTPTSDSARSFLGSAPRARSFPDFPGQPRLVPPAPRREVRRHNFPEYATSFIGREQARSDLRRLIATTRLLTATGPGGVGKSRLALQVAADVLDAYPDGAWLVELAGLADSRLVPHTVARALGIRERAGQDLLQTLTDALRDRRLLLVLDNCEHLINASAQLADSLLRGCPDVRILATSRTLLDVAGETAWRVPSLGLPDSDGREVVEQLASSEAIRLFVERAQAARPDFALDARTAPAVTTVCERLDGMPLAIELAAPLVRVLEPEQIADHLDRALSVLISGPRAGAARHQTLRATLDWSYELLSDRERRMFGQLSVFAGGWTLEAAQAVCAGDGELTPGADVLNLLRRLVDQSLVAAEPGDGVVRFRLLETLRQYAAERLEARAETETVRRRHAVYYATWVAQLGDAACGPDNAGRRARVDREQDNIRAALRWLIQHGEAQHAQQLSGAMGSFWQLGGRSNEGRAWLAEVQALPDGDRKTAARVRLLDAASTLAAEQADYAIARLLAEEALELARELDDDVGAALALTRLALLAWYRREFALASTLAAEGVATSVAAGERALEGMNRRLAAQSAHDLGDPRAGLLADQAQAVLAEAEYPGGVAWALTTIGQIHLTRGDLGAARAVLDRALALYPKGVVGVGQMWTLANLGWVATEQGDIATAHACLLDALVMARDALGGRARLAMPMEGLAQVAAACGRAATALRLASAAAMLRQTYAVPATPTERVQLDRWLSRARARIGARAAEAAWEAGRRLTAEEAVIEALAVDIEQALPDGAQVVRHASSSALTAREGEVAMLVAEGLGTRQIAEHLVIAEGTVRVHVERILSKLGLHSRMQLAAWVVHRRPAPTPAS